MFEYRIGGLVLEIGFNKADRVDLIESHSRGLTLLGRPLSDGYKAFASQLKKDGWKLTPVCAGPGGPEEATHGSPPRSHETAITWTGRQAFVAISSGLPVPPASCPPGGA